MSKTIECPRCRGRVSAVFRGQTLEDALERHERLSHEPRAGTKVKTSKLSSPPPVEQQGEAVKILRRRVVK